jgi:hypothetical protein
LKGKKKQAQRGEREYKIHDPKEFIRISPPRIFLS